MRVWALLVFGVFASSACHTSSEGGKGKVNVIEPPPAAPSSVTTPPEPDAGPPRPIRGAPKGDKELPTTSGTIAMASLDADIVSLTKKLEQDPKRAMFVRDLAGKHHLRGRVRGDLDEIDEAIKLTSKLIELEPNDPTHWLERAIRQQALHRFKESQADVEQAKKLGASADAIANVQAELDWNAGNYEPARAQILAARTKKPSASTWLREGVLRFELGENEAADRAFEEAEDAISDTSPFPVVQLDVTRGIHKADTGQLEAAVVFFREALRRLPAHVGAAEHLAETLRWLGQDDEAMQLYEDLVKRSRDPEPMGALASLYRAKGKAKEADQLVAKATARYGELLKKYPEAMYWHAASYFLEEGNDPRRALDLLEKNAALRPTCESWVGLAKAQLANGAVAEAKASIEKALATPVESAEKFYVAAKIQKKAGDGAKARSLAKRATAINPQAEKIFGKL